MSVLPTRRLARCGLDLSILGFGGAPVGSLYEDMPDEEAVGAISAAFESGFRYIDTAPFYGHGLSEHRVGQALRRLPRDQIVVSTKVGRLLRPARGRPVDTGLFAAPMPFEPVFDYSYDGAMRSLEDSFQRLGLDHVDIALIHDVNPRWHGDAYPRRFTEAMEGAYRALDELRSTGEVKAIGVGVNDWRVLLEFAKVGRFDCFMLAGRYTLLDHSSLEEFLPYCEREGIGVLLAGPYNSGILATGVRDGATFFYAPADQEVRERTGRMEGICARHEVPLAAVALQFTAAHPAISSVVVGCRSAEEAQANADLLRVPIPAALWDELKSNQLIATTAPVPAPSAEIA